MAGIYLQMLAGTGRDGEVLRLAGRRFLIGRGGACEVRVASEVSSRRHATVVLEERGWVLKDLDSRNGTILNGKRISEADLRPLDKIQIGAKGPRMLVVTMEPAPRIVEEGADPTRVLHIHGHGSDGAPPISVETTPSEPAREESVPVAAPLPEAPEPPQAPPPVPMENRRRRRMPPILAVLGLLFAGSIALGVWGPEFPYEPATAPILWCMAALRYVAPNAIPDPGTQLWVFRGLLMLYGLVAGILLQRPIRRMVPLVALAGLHVIVALAL